jgi:hypothetical protein
MKAVKVLSFDHLSVWARHLSSDNLHGASFFGHSIAPSIELHITWMALHSN